MGVSSDRKEYFKEEMTWRRNYWRKNDSAFYEENFKAPGRRHTSIWRFYNDIFKKIFPKVKVQCQVLSYVQFQESRESIKKIRDEIEKGRAEPALLNPIFQNAFSSDGELIDKGPWIGVWNKNPFGADFPTLFHICFIKQWGKNWFDIHLSDLLVKERAKKTKWGGEVVLSEEGKEARVLFVKRAIMLGQNLLKVKVGSGAT